MSIRVFGRISFITGMVISMMGIISLFITIDQYYKHGELGYLILFITGILLVIGFISFVLGLILLIMSRKKKE